MLKDYTDFSYAFARGSTFRFPMTVKIDGAATNIDAWTQFRFTAKRFRSDADASAVVALTLGSGITRRTQSGSDLGVVDIEIPASATTPLANRRHVLFATLEGVDGSGKPWTLAQGTLVVGIDTETRTT